MRRNDEGRGVFHGERAGVVSARYSFSVITPPRIDNRVTRHRGTTGEASFLHRALAAV
jgi:hypothetical protein